MLKEISVNRIIDANINRTKEGLRVCEEITRFILQDYRLTSKLKKVRHDIDLIVKKKLPANIKLIGERNALKDIGRNIYARELKRKDISDIFFANMQRIKESTRVLEEFSKLKNISAAIDFKTIRYTLYELEKTIVKKLLFIHNSR